MCNVLAHNRHDHVKNFAFIMDDLNAEWRLSPAYDLVFASGPGGEYTMTINGEGHNPGREQMLKLALCHALTRSFACHDLDFWPEVE